MNSFESMRDCLALLQSGLPHRAEHDIDEALEEMPADDPCRKPMFDASVLLKANKPLEAKTVLSEAFWKMETEREKYGTRT
jgi:hypothetical protein